MLEYEQLARSVLLERFSEENSRERRFRKEWAALRAAEARAPRAEAEELRIDRLRERQREDLDRAA